MFQNHNDELHTHTHTIFQMVVQFCFEFLMITLFCYVAVITVTPDIIGDFPSIILKTSSAASSLVLSLKRFLANSERASLNWLYVMVRADLFLQNVVENIE